MKPSTANILNSILLIVVSGYAFFSSPEPSVTALIPAIAGLILFSLTPWFKPGNKVAAHIAVLLTFLVLIALIKPLTGVFGRSDQGAIFRVALMMLSSLFALAIFITSFVKARMNR